ncbi:MAG: hypothetical protein KF760_28280 [Candidatus Eremiobacteraeota bacterium]|nr:hypothetical protein [Candidatus Eremiobacteraeota bacterium]MCW5865794.1 hypothetical protein [Candidatus Eremiobacteraeota bacterium]
MSNLGSNFPKPGTVNPSKVDRASQHRAAEAAVPNGVQQPANQGGNLPTKEAGEVVKGLDAANNTKEFRDAAATARRNEVNRPGRGPDGAAQVRQTAGDLRAGGHQVDKSSGRKLNGEFVARNGGKDYQVPKELGPDGKPRVKDGAWVPPSDPRGPGNKVTVGPEGLQTDRVHGAHNPKGGGFTVPKGSTDGLLRSEIQEKLALDKPPTHRQSVTHQPGVQLNQSVIGDQPGHGKVGGQGQQFEIPNRDNVRNQFGGSVRLNDTEVRAQRFADKLGKVGKVFKPIGVATDAIELGQAFQKDGGTVGKNTVKAATNVAGGWAGAAAGAKGGALLGAALGTAVPVVGNIAGGIIGGVVGGIGGALLGGNLGNWLFG